MPDQTQEDNQGFVESVRNYGTHLILGVRMRDQTFREFRVHPNQAWAYPRNTILSSRAIDRLEMNQPQRTPRLESRSTPAPRPSIWTRGDPYPEDWPAWLRRANIEWCEVEIEDDLVIWHDGVWESGHWVNGTWHNGVWHYGDWHNGTWYDGSWYGGVWCNGVWHKGSWRNGSWRNGTWHNGIWLNGSWLHGLWYNGVWMDGIWYNGVWHNGNWHTGHQMRPRFGWAIYKGGIRGYLPDSGMVVLPEHEWRPLLGDMDPLKVDEFELILQFKRALDQKPSAEGLTLWEHLDD